MNSIGSSDSRLRPFPILKVSFTQGLNVIGLRWSYCFVFRTNLLLSHGIASAKEWALSCPSERKDNIEVVVVDCTSNFVLEVVDASACWNKDLFVCCYV